MILTLNKPINISLQSKPLTVAAGLQTHSGAWDIIYFVRMDNGSPVGDIYRLGKVIDLVQDGNMLSSELASDNSFATTATQNISTTGNHWTTQGEWRIENQYALMQANSSSTSTLSQNLTNSSISSYQDGEYIKTGRTYQVSFDVVAVGTYFATQTVNGTFNGVKDIVLDSVVGLSVGMLLHQSSQSAGIAIVGTPKITNISGNTITLDVAQTFADGIGLTFEGSNIRVGGYTAPDTEIFDQTTTLGTKTVEFIATSDGLSIVASANAIGWKINNISVKEVYPTSSSTYAINVEPDATAQTPNDGDFIFFGKDNEIGTAGVTGYYATVEMKNDSIDYAELFAVSSEITQSSK